MKIKFHKKFKKYFDKLSLEFLELKNKAILAIKKFEKNPRDRTPGNHALTGKLRDFRAFSVTGNVRIIFKKYDDYVFVIMLDIGTHNQVYK